MKQTINRYQFHDAFKNMNRSDNFSYNGLDKLFEYFGEYEDSTGEEIELDVIAICCEWSEAPLVDVLKDYNLESLEELQDRTQVIEVDDETVIYQVF